MHGIFFQVGTLPNKGKMQCLEKINHDTLTNKKNQWPNKFKFTLGILHFAEFLEVEGFTACCSHLQNIFSK